MNYVLLFPDEMRAESLACYGHPVVKTPNIDELAAQGTLFEQAYTQHPVCGPSRACLATGWYPHVDGRRSYCLLDPDMPNFFTYLRKAGYITCHCGKDDMFTRDGMAEVFTDKRSFREERSQKGRQGPPPEISKYTMLTPPVKDGETGGDQRFTNDAMDFISQRAQDGKPFFLMLSWAAPHPDYTCPKHYYDMYDPEALPPLRNTDWLDGKPDLYREIRRFRKTEEKDPDIYKKVNAVYLGMITMIDDLVGKVVECLKEKGLYDDTTIILCSDHGDFSGDCGLVEKWPSAMDDMLTRVPLIIRRPGCPSGRRIKELVESHDIMPTVCDFEGVAIEHDQFGVSLKPQVEGADGDPERAVYTEGGYDLREPHCFEPECFKCVGGRYNPNSFDPDDHYYPKMAQQNEAPDTVCRVVSQRYKNWKLVVRTNGQNELYDMEADPREYHNLYGKEGFKELTAQLTLKLASWQLATSDVMPRIRHA